MATASFGFLALAALAAVLHNLWSNRLWRDATFFLVNVVFLASFSTSPVAFVPLAAFLAAGYLAIQISRTRPSGVAFGLLVVAVVAAFAWLKKYWIFAPIGFIQTAYLTLGLSYIFFRVLHLVIDAREGSIERPLGVLSYLNYTLNFATLVAGPIQRYQDFAQPRRRLTIVAAGRAIERVVIGLFKVLVLAMIVSTVQTQATTDLSGDLALPDRIGTGLVSIGLYPIYLYFNFSGYTDIVIGVARFIGLELPENFDRPFSSLNFMEFWTRWHMTLSNWFKAYVYTPLIMALMSRFSSPRLDLAIGTVTFFITFFLIGLWHGQTFIFVVYGLLLGLGVSVNKIYQTMLARRLGRKRWKALAAHPLYQACARGLTYTWYAATILCFWATGDEALRILEALGPSGIIGGFIALFIASTLVLGLYEAARNRVLAVSWHDAPLILSRHLRTVWATTLAFVAAASVLLAATPAPDIVYKAF
ncbi:MAG TPA: MBOAT family O-acyltransferase [Methylomirabilota bacterium]|nr:MBOAT family O-acyltransferase [Methylomirabilota bacterium]